MRGAIGGGTRRLLGPLLRPMRRGGVFVLAPLVVLYEVVLGRRSLLIYDAQDYFIPKYVEAARQWRRGILPVWDPTVFSGSPLLGAGQAGIFYPFNVLYLFLPTLVAYQLLILAHMVIGGIGARLLAKRLLGNDWAASITGAAYSICGYTIAHLAHTGFFPGIAWLPWMFFGAELLLERATARNALVLAGAVAMTGLGGHPQPLFIDLLAVGLYIAVRCTALRASRSNLFGIGLSGGIGMLVASAQLIPTRAYANLGARPQLNFKGAMEFALPAARLPLLVFPYLFGSDGPTPMFNHSYPAPPYLREIIAYPGMVVLVLAACGVNRIRRESAMIALAIAAILAMFLALGPSTPVAHLFYRLVPVSRDFRVWPRHLLIVDLAIAVFAGLGTAELMHADPSRRALAVRRGVIGLGVLGAFGWWATRWHRSAGLVAPGSARIAALFIPLGFGAAALLLLCLLVLQPGPGQASGGASRSTWILPTVMVALIIADLGVFAANFEWRYFAMPIARARTASRPDGDLAFGKVVNDPGGIDRVANESGTYNASYTTKGLLTVNGYDPLYPREYGIALGNMNQYGGLLRPDLWNPKLWIADILRVTTIALNNDEANGIAGLGTEWRRVRAAAGVPETVWTRAPRLGDVFTVGQVRTVSFGRAVIVLRGGSPVPGNPAGLLLDASQTALVDGRCPECSGLDTPGAAGRVASVRRSPNRWRASVVMQRPGVVAFSRSYLPGTKASVDGHRVPVRRIDALVSGVVVGAGTHTVAIWYAAPGLETGVALTVLGLMLWLVWLAVDRRRCRERDRPEADADDPRAGSGDSTLIRSRPTPSPDGPS